MNSTNLEILVFLAVFAGFAALLRSYLDRRFYQRRLEELHRRTLDAQRRLRQIGVLASEVAHEIKNPITAILCSAETLDLLIGPKLEKVHRDSLRFIKDYGDEVLRLVSDFLDVSRSETGKLVPKPQSVNLARSVDSILGLLKSSALARGVALHNCVDDKELCVHVDPKHLKQVIFNFVHNAIKFTEDGGEVHVTAKIDFPHDHVRVAVKDNGRGIKPEDKERIFAEFEMGEGGATGLGLSLCKSLLALADSSISLESEVGVGSVFSFPLRKAEPATASQAIRRRRVLTAEGVLDGKSVIVFDEAQGSRESIGGLFEAWGAKVSRVSLAVDLFEAVAKEEFDLVVINDPADGLYGFELSRMLHEEFQQRDFDFLLFTTRKPHHAIIGEQQLPVTCIPKPVNGKVILESIQNKFQSDASAH